jgi:[ribosomal protein S18]-alanine N-acetyltransferase
MFLRARFFQSASLLMATMRAQDVEEVVAIENQAYPFPWSRGNFLDSLNSGYDAWVMRELDGQIAGYFLAMPVVDEMHLLNITVRPTLQGKKLGRLLLNKVITLAREAKMQSILLEVRPSNPRALAFYQHVGFEQIGIRKNYYPSTGATREDAIVMRLMIVNQDHEA